jgi:integrase
MRRSKAGRRPKGPRLYLRAAERGSEGRWVILDQWADGRRRYVSTGASESDRATAERFFAAYLAEKHVPKFGDGRPHQVLIADVLAYYAEHKAKKAMRQDCLKLSILMLGEFFVGKMVNDITPDLSNRYVEWRIRRGDARGSNKWQARAPNTTRLLEPTTARNDLIVLQAAVRFCWENRKLAQNIPVLKPKASEARHRFLTRSELARLVAGALGWDRHGVRHRKRINYHLARLILIGIYTGTRRDRILRLQWVENLQGGWIDLERGMLHRRASNEPETKKKAPSVPLANRLLAHLHRARRVTARFVIEHNGRNIENNVFTAFEGACRLAGLNYDGQDKADRVTPHTLRHTCVSWALADGKSPYQVGRYVGMSAQMAERVYGHVNDEAQRETANAIGRNVPRPRYGIATQIPKKG